MRYLNPSRGQQLRFYVQKLNKKTVTSSWVAEQGVAALSARCSRATANKAKRTLEEAKRRHRAYLKSKRTVPPPALIEAAVWLASLDTVFRCGFVDPKMFAPPPRALMEDLQSMLAIEPVEHFRGTRCVLNPTFGPGSELVGGADDDLIIDDTLIDLKTTKHLTFGREHFNQLAGYYLLSCIGGVDDCEEGGINYLAIYFARYGFFHRIPVARCIAESKLPALLRWLKKRAGR
ncbi:MAG TPA: hypothetical protein VN911_05055 [Candidatus Acidoferrum sp.]|nr:hypothetical protein [Candidatus Acidoferrum sp.]